ncbi:hypothetical protein [Lignipirellula cremea]|uniref:hypothetical protein n=1 Tax=Lignipirellula cremea TaxID=2528010 RepID=UPI0011A66396|nr:hypothetical protein [Lignipirellula cremea]
MKAGLREAILLVDLYQHHGSGYSMSFVLQPWQLLFAILSGWIHHRQQQIIEFQNDQIQSRMALNPPKSFSG